MSWFNKLHNRRQPAGLERQILNNLPYVLIGGTLLPAYIAMSTRMFFILTPQGQNEKIISFVDILSIGVVITLWTAVFTIAIGCVMVIVMKGPAYIADSYPLQDSSRPRKDFQHESKN